VNTIKDGAIMKSADWYREQSLLYASRTCLSKFKKKKPHHRQPKPAQGNTAKQMYIDYLSSPRWIEFRSRIIAKRGPYCEDCGVLGRVQLHHLTYTRLGREHDSDVKLLCGECHMATHKIKIWKASDSDGVDKGC